MWQGIAIGVSLLSGVFLIIITILVLYIVKPRKRHASGYNSVPLKTRNAPRGGIPEKFEPAGKDDDDEDPGADGDENTGILTKIPLKLLIPGCIATISLIVSIIVTAVLFS